jgi:glycosyltransferase involved in cell wall biosynthesis
LILVGHHENKQYATGVQDLVRAHGLCGRVEFVGKISQAKLAERMRRAGVFVLPSLSEGLGRVVVEAMATGLPVVGSQVGGIPEMVEEGVTGFLVRPGDETMLAERLRWILEHPDEAQEIGRRARVFAERFFSTETYVAGYQRLFNLALGMSTGPRDYARSSL